MQKFCNTLFPEGNRQIALMLLLIFCTSVLNPLPSMAKEISREGPQKIEISPTVKYYEYGNELRKIDAASATLQDDAIFDNTNFLGGFYSGATPSERLQDWGTSPGGMVTSMQIGVATSAPELDVTIIIYTGTTDSDTGSVIATIPLTGLEGSDDGQLAGFSYNITLESQAQFQLPAGPCGYAYVTADADGPLTANGGEGITDGFRQLPDPTVYGFTSGFAQFWMQLNGDANEVVPPPNDECTTATEINTFPFTETINTRGATNNPADPMLSCNDDGMQTDGQTVWYVWTPDATQTVFMTTQGSDYDTAIGVYTGACGDLTEVGCADTGLEDDLVFDVMAGVTYFIKIGEYVGGAGAGTLVFSIQQPPALYQGPSNGSATTGVSVSTDNFSPNKVTRIISRKRDHNTFKPKTIKRDKPVVQPLGAPGSNFVQDLAATPKGKGNNLINAPYLEEGFNGIDDSGFIPPDPIIAAGPNHLIALVNSEIGIFDKHTGERLKLINGDDWYSNILPGSGICDPQVIYDHFAERWVMLWIECGDLQPTLLFSVSDDSNPLGNWCSYALPGDVNGNSARLDFFNDFPKMGLDDKAIYVMSNMFDLSGGGGFRYVQIRVIGKQQLYEGSCGGTVTWTDLWDLRDPTTLTTTFTTVPYLAYENTSQAYFVDVEFSFVGTYLNVWTLNDPLGTPSFTAESVPVTAFTEPGAPNQRGGSTILFEGGSRTIRQPAIYRDGDLWISRSVGDEDGIYARVNYTRIDAATKTVEEDFAFGADGFWYFYPAATVDANKNLFVTFTRSGENEFASARYLGRQDGDAPGVQTSALLKAGEANYVKDFSSGRNRWGDYNGIAVDPDGQSVWMFTEYSKAPSSTWGTWIGNASFDAPAGAHIVFDPDSINFDAVEAGSTSLPGTITVQNSGQDDLTINNIALSNTGSGFDLQDLPTLPVTLSSFEGFEFSAVFTTSMDLRETNAIIITSNDADNPTVTIPVVGKTPARLSLAQTSVNVTADNAVTTSFSFSLENTGGDNLDYEIGFTGVASFTPVAPAKPVFSDNLQKADRNDLSKFDVGLKKVRSRESDKAASEVLALFQYEVSTPPDPNEPIALGVEFDGVNFWVSGAGNPNAIDNRLYKYDVSGNFIAGFDQGTTSGIGWTDLAFDGAFLYGLDRDALIIHQVDPNTGTQTGTTITSPANGLRAIAHDPATDHFWLSGLQENIYEIDREGNVVNTYPNPGSLGIRGLAWDNSSLGGPYLWVWSDDGNGTLASLFDPEAGIFTGLTFDGLFGTSIAGGAAFANNLPTDPAGAGVLIGLHQDSNDIVIGYAVPPFWLTDATPGSGFVPSGESEEIEVSINVRGLDFGQYKGGVLVETNDELRPVSVIEVTLVNDFGTSVESGSEVPKTFALQQNYPNPFNPETKIRYTIPGRNHVSVVVYNILGQKIRTLVDKVQIADTHEISWDGKSDAGHIQPTGIYIIRLRSGNYGETIKMSFVK